MDVYPNNIKIKQTNLANVIYITLANLILILICGLWRTAPNIKRSNHLSSSHNFMKLLLRDWPLAPRHNYLTNHDEEDDKDEEEEDDYHDDD